MLLYCFLKRSYENIIFNNVIRILKRFLGNVFGKTFRKWYNNDTCLLGRRLRRNKIIIIITVPKVYMLKMLWKIVCMQVPPFGGMKFAMPRQPKAISKRNVRDMR